MATRNFIIIGHGELRTEHIKPLKGHDSSMKTANQITTFTSPNTNVFTLSAPGDCTGQTPTILRGTLDNMKTKIGTNTTFDGLINILKDAQAGLEGGYYCGEWLDHIKKYTPINPNPIASCYSQHNTINDKYITFYDEDTGLDGLLDIWYLNPKTYKYVSGLSKLKLTPDFSKTTERETYPGYYFSSIIGAIRRAFPTDTINIIDYSCSVSQNIVSIREKRAAARSGYATFQQNIKKKPSKGGKRRRQTTKKRRPRNRRSRRTTK